MTEEAYDIMETEPPVRFGSMEQSAEIHEWMVALGKVQDALEIVAKTAENTFHHSRYADLASVWKAAKKPLRDNGFVVSQWPDMSSDGLGLGMTTEIYHVPSRQYRRVRILMPSGGNAQAVGSAITYGRRYALAPLIMLVTGDEDDDGNTASNLPNGRETGYSPQADQARKRAAAENAERISRGLEGPRKPTPTTEEQPSPLPPSGETKWKGGKALISDAQAGRIYRIACDRARALGAVDANVRAGARKIIGEVLGRFQLKVDTEVTRDIYDEFCEVVSMWSPPDETEAAGPPANLPF